MNPRCDLDLEDSKKTPTTTKKTNQTKNLRMTLWVMMLHHHTKFGNKMFCDSENIRTNIH